MDKLEFKTPPVLEFEEKVVHLYRINFKWTSMSWKLYLPYSVSQQSCLLKQIHVLINLAIVVSTPEPLATSKEKMESTDLVLLVYLFLV